MKPNWQRARLLRARLPEHVGKELWVKIERPQSEAAWNFDRTEILPPEPRVHVHLVDEEGRLCSAPNVWLERLGRSTEDFADEVKPQHFEDWIRSGIDSDAVLLH